MESTQPSVDEAAAGPDAEDLRTQRIFQLRQRLARGEYEIDAEEIARRMLDEL